VCGGWEIGKKMGHISSIKESKAGECPLPFLRSPGPGRSKTSLAGKGTIPREGGEGERSGRRTLFKPEFDMSRMKTAAYPVGGKSEMPTILVLCA